MTDSIESAQRPVFAWTSFGGIPDDAAKGEWFTDPSGKLRQAMEDLPKGYIPWLEEEGTGAWRGPQDGSAAFHPGNIAGGHKPLPVAGYTAQPDAKVALVNEFKADEERLLRKLDALLPGDNRPIDQKTGERVGEPHVIVDGRWLAIGRTQLQEAFMSINRAVFQPQRIRLPEDDE